MQPTLPGSGPRPNKGRRKLCKSSTRGVGALRRRDRCALCGDPARHVQFFRTNTENCYVTTSRDDLLAKLRDGYRGIIVTIMQKFQPGDFHVDRRNVIVLVDEAHRTTGSDLGTFASTGLNKPALLITGPVATPEPTGLALLGLGVPAFLGAMRLRRRTA